MEAVNVFPPQVWPPTIVVDGHTYQLEDRPQLEVLEDIATGYWAGIFPESLSEDDFLYIGLRLQDPDDPLDTYRLVLVARLVVETVSGTSFDAAQKLAAQIVANWFMFSAWCVLHNVDPETASVARLIASSYAWVASMQKDEKALMKYNSQLWPPSARTHTAADEAAIVAQALAS